MSQVKGRLKIERFYFEGVKKRMGGRGSTYNNRFGTTMVSPGWISASGSARFSFSY